VIENAGQPQIQGLFELSFAIPESDRLRFVHYGVAINEVTDCRFGLMLGPGASDRSTESNQQSGTSRIRFWHDLTASLEPRA
jgi:hypothetical protein